MKRFASLWRRQKSCDDVILNFFKINTCFSLFENLCVCVCAVVWVVVKVKQPAFIRQPLLVGADSP